MNRLRLLIAVGDNWNITIDRFKSEWVLGGSAR